MFYVNIFQVKFFLWRERRSVDYADKSAEGQAIWWMSHRHSDDKKTRDTGSVFDTSYREP